MTNVSGETVNELARKMKMMGAFESEVNDIGNVAWTMMEKSWERQGRFQEV